MSGYIHDKPFPEITLPPDLHPLALEDVLKGNPRTRSKADYYTRHLFLRVLCHKLGKDDPDANGPNVLHPDRTASPEPLDPIDEDLKEDETNRKSRGSEGSLKHRPILPTSRNDVKHNSVSSADSPNSLSTLIMKESAVRQIISISEIHYSLFIGESRAREA